MSTKVESKTQIASAGSPSEAQEKTTSKRKEESGLDKFLKFLSSVKFGIAQLVLLMIFSMLGTFIVQQGTSDFDKFYNALTPSEASLYEKLGFFDIYHVWYFNLLLITLSLNIILASIDRAPGHWHFFNRPKVAINENYARYQPWHAHFKLTGASLDTVVKQLGEHAHTVLMPRWTALFGPLAKPLSRLSSLRWRVTAEDAGTSIFVERGVWNRLAFCAVHVALLTILVGWFVGNKWGHKGVIMLAPGESSATFITPGLNNNVNTFQMPFKLLCYDIQQDLIDSNKPDMAPQNTLDWHTRVIFQDSNKKEFARNVHLNEPVDFKGYRFFQASFDPDNTAREVVLQLTPKDGKGQALDVKLVRPGTKLELTNFETSPTVKLAPASATADVPGVGKIRWKNFYPDFRFGKGGAVSESSDYVRPVAEVEVLQPDGVVKDIYGFTPQMLESVKNAPFLTDKTVIGEYNVILKSYEKVSKSHTLQVQYDPGVNIIYWGCAFLVFCLISVFFFGHERIWVYIKPGSGDEINVYFAGNTNRNKPAFEMRYNQLLAKLAASFPTLKEVKNERPKAEKLETA